MALGALCSLPEPLHLSELHPLAEKGMEPKHGLINGRGFQDMLRAYVGIGGKEEYLACSYVKGYEDHVSRAPGR